MPPKQIVIYDAILQYTHGFKRFSSKIYSYGYLHITCPIFSFSMRIRLLFSLLITAISIQIFAQGGPPQRTQHVQQYPRYAQPAAVLEELREGWNLSLGMNFGVSRLKHGIDFQRTPLLDYYNSIAALPSIPDSYDWETFMADIDADDRLQQPRFGFSGHLSYANIPAFLSAEIGTSSSSYQSMYLGATIGLSKDFFFGDDFFFSASGGYKIIFKDAGFGAPTIINSIGNEENRKYMSRFFAPDFALGPDRGDLATMRAAFGKYMGADRKTSVGVEFYGELDLTAATLRIARMNTVGLNAYLRFVLF